MSYLNFQIKTYNGYGTSSAPSGDQLFYDFKTFLKGIGWTVPQSSDGLTFDQTGTDKITGVGTGAGGLSNPGAWFILKEPSPGIGSQRREFLFFKNTSAYSDQSQSFFRTIAYSVQGFSTVVGNGHGSASTSATNPPIAFDEVWMHGLANTFQNPTNCYSQTIGSSVPANSAGYNYWADTQNSAYSKMQYVFCASNTAPFFWYILSIGQSTENNFSIQPFNLMMYDPLGIYESAEPDPSVLFYTSSKGNTTLSSYSPCTWANQKFYFTWMNYVSFTSKTDANNRINTAHSSVPCSAGDILGYQALCTRTLWGDSGSIVYTGLSPYKHKASLPAMYVYQDTNSGKRYIKGVSKYVRSTLVQVAPFSMETVNSTNDYIYIPINGNNVYAKTFTMLPWNGSILPIF